MKPESHSPLLLFMAGVGAMFIFMILIGWPLWEYYSEHGTTFHLPKYPLTKNTFIAISNQPIDLRFDERSACEDELQKTCRDLSLREYINCESTEKGNWSKEDCVITADAASRCYYDSFWYCWHKIMG